jgi:hypothetical protein
MGAFVHSCDAVDVARQGKQTCKLLCECWGSLGMALQLNLPMAFMACSESSANHAAESLNHAQPSLHSCFALLAAIRLRPQPGT